MIYLKIQSSLLCPFLLGLVSHAVLRSIYRVAQKVKPLWLTLDISKSRDFDLYLWD